jgi:HPt (histidine-containing phosphotransfer) domain-containing protein
LPPQVESLAIGKLEWAVQPAIGIMEVQTMERSTAARTRSIEDASAMVRSEGSGDSTIFDYQDCLRRLGGDAQLFNDILDIFLEDAPLLLEQARSSLASGDSETLTRAAHTIRGLSANFAAASAVSASYAVELHAREQKLEMAAQCLPRLESEVHRLEAALADFRLHHEP